MKNLIKKLQEKKKKDPAHFTKKQLEDRDKEIIEKAKKDIDEQEKQNQIAIKHIQKELPKYLKDKIELLKLRDAINDRFKVTSTDTNAAKYGIASVYFNAIEVEEIPEDFYPNADPDIDGGGFSSDEHYYLWKFQQATADNWEGHTIPSRPGTTKEYVIHGFLFPMTSTVIYLGKWSEDPDSQFIVNWQPNDELFGREWLSNNKEDLFKTYKEALKCFYEFIEKHLDGDEERYYNLKKNQN